ncbi:MAG: hypothetical protein FWD95_15120 [Nocardioidaceae bacterium]|nr:hypothetical protein [Nocardioidaceae bacterium]
MTDTDALTDLLGSAILTRAPEAGDTRDPLEVVRRTAQAEEIVGDLLHHSVITARAAGHSWAAIGAALDMTRQAAQKRFGARPEAVDEAERRTLGPVTAFDEMHELELAGRMGWHTVGAGLLCHRMIRTATQWEHRRVAWVKSPGRYEKEGWRIGCKAFPWLYLIRDTGLPAEG